jgi:hypothetical protein
VTLEQTVARQGEYIGQQAGIIGELQAWIQQHTLVESELRSFNALLFENVKGMTASQATAQRRIAELEVHLEEEEDSDADSLAQELLELRRWKAAFCERETNSLIAELEQSRAANRELQAEVERLQAAAPAHD